MIQYFTFGFGQGHDHGYVTVVGTDDKGEARAAMVEHFGHKWGFQYDSAEQAGVERFYLRHVATIMLRTQGSLVVWSRSLHAKTLAELREAVEEHVCEACRGSDEACPECGGNGFARGMEVALCS